MNERHHDGAVCRDLVDRARKRRFIFRAPAECSPCRRPILIGTEVTGYKVGTWIIRHLRCP